MLVFACRLYDDDYSGGSCSLTDCLREFTSEETLKDNEAVYCSQCKKHRTVTKKLSIYK